MVFGRSKVPSSLVGAGLTSAGSDFAPFSGRRHPRRMPLVDGLGGTFTWGAQASSVVVWPARAAAAAQQGDHRPAASSRYIQNNFRLRSGTI